MLPPSYTHNILALVSYTPAATTVDAREGMDFNKQHKQVVEVVLARIVTYTGYLRVSRVYRGNENKQIIGNYWYYVGSVLYASRRRI